MISKELFCEIIADLKTVDDYVDELNRVIIKYKYDGCIIPVNCFDTVLKILQDIFKDNDDWIGYYIFELNWGRQYEPGVITDTDHNEIKLSNPEELYDFLMENMSAGGDLN